MGARPHVLVTGAGGQVGLALRAHLPEATFLTRAELDVTDAAAVAEALEGADLVVHTAAMTDVDGCERDPERAEAVNGGGAANVAAAGARVIHLSTDYVFSGSEPGRVPRGRPDRAARRLRPLEARGRAGRAGAAGEPRRAHVVGLRRRPELHPLDPRAPSGPGTTLRVVDDQRGRPTWAGDLARAIAFLAGRDDSGILHVTGAGEPCTWADLAEVVVGHPVERITSEEFGAPAPRPRNSALSLERARSLGVPLADWRDSVMRFLDGER